MKTSLLPLMAVSLASCQFPALKTALPVEAPNVRSIKEFDVSSVVRIILGPPSPAGQQEIEKLFIADSRSLIIKKALADEIVNNFPSDEVQGIEMDRELLRFHFLLHKFDGLIETCPVFTTPILGFLEKILDLRPDSITLKHAIETWAELGTKE